MQHAGKGEEQDRKKKKKKEREREPTCEGPSENCPGAPPPIAAEGVIPGERMSGGMLGGGGGLKLEDS